MHRYMVSHFDGNTFVVMDQTEQRGVCDCSDYDDWEDAANRANMIVLLLQQNIELIAE